MSHPFIIWTEPRTAGTTLSAALKSVSEHPSVQDEPFEKMCELAHVYERWLNDRDPAPVDRVFGRHVVMKHISEHFDEGFEITLARAAERHGYRHIRLVRANRFAQLVSLGVAAQTREWRRLASVDHAEPINVPAVIGDAKACSARWRAVSQHISACLLVRTEDVTSRDRERRHGCLRQLLRFLELPPERLGALDHILGQGGQGTERVWPLIPNLGALRAAIAAEGIG